MATLRLDKRPWEGCKRWWGKRRWGQKDTCDIKRYFCRFKGSKSKALRAFDTEKPPQGGWQDKWVRPLFLIFFCCPPLNQIQPTLCFLPLRSLKQSAVELHFLPNYSIGSFHQPWPYKLKLFLKPDALFFNFSLEHWVLSLSLHLSGWCCLKSPYLQSGF